jgi:hypothetical protein
LAAIFRLPSVLFSSDNQSQERTSNMMLLTNLVNDDKNGIDGLEHRMRNISPHCKSGKDRNGGMLIDWAKKTLEFHFGKNEKTIDNLKNQISAGYMQRMAGWLGGGTPGGDGLKAHSGLSGKEYLPYMENIELKSAKKNKIDNYIEYKGEIILSKTKGGEEKKIDLQSQGNSNYSNKINSKDSTKSGTIIKIENSKQLNDFKSTVGVDKVATVRIKKGVYFR